MLEVFLFIFLFLLLQTENWKEISGICIRIRHPHFSALPTVTRAGSKIKPATPLQGGNSLYLLGAETRTNLQRELLASLQPLSLEMALLLFN